eukprot:jgi/Chlat1/2076/Chrsp17S02535
MTAAGQETWKAAKALAEQYGGDVRALEKAAVADPAILHALQLQDPAVPYDSPFPVDEVDIVIPTIRNLDFLEMWRPYLINCHLIIVKDGDPNATVSVPEGYSYDMYTRADMERVMGPRVKCISQRSAACRCFGFLVSKKKYILTIDDDCFVAKTPQGKDVDILQGHLFNLKTPALPYYFNTMYDPYEPDADFVACYPYSLRQGVPTAMSHGMWLNIPDYDGPTQLAIDASSKPAEKSFRYVDATLTLPKGTLFSCCGMNLSFDRTLVGPCMYFGLMGMGTPWGRYEDMWAGWCTKVICDHLGLGVKTGKPYVWHSKASNAYANWSVEAKGIEWQDTIVPFFQNLQLNGASVQECYREIAEAVRQELTKLDPYFNLMADMMLMWLDAWNELCPDTPGYHKTP